MPASTLDQVRHHLSDAERVIHYEHLENLRTLRALQFDRGLLGGHVLVPRARQVARIQDEHHAAIAHHRAADDALDPAQMAPQGLDDNLTATQELVDHKGDLPITALGDDYGQEAFRALGRRWQAEPFTQTNHVYSLLINGDNRRVTHPFKRLGCEAYDLGYVGEGDSEGLTIGLDQEHPGNRQRQRQANHKRHALPWGGVDADLALQPLDGRLHHIHSHPAPRDFAHLLRRAEARPEDQSIELLMGEPGSIFL